MSRSRRSASTISRTRYVLAILTSGQMRVVNLSAPLESPFGEVNTGSSGALRHDVRRCGKRPGQARWSRLTLYQT
jgi:hypothetical protein